MDHRLERDLHETTLLLSTLSLHRKSSEVISFVEEVLQDDWSSENEEDQKYPSSIKTKMKKIVHYAKKVAPSRSEYALPSCQASTKMKTISKNTKKNQYICNFCGHTFELKKTLYMHSKVCNKLV